MVRQTPRPMALVLFTSVLSLMVPAFGAEPEVRMIPQASAQAGDGLYLPNRAPLAATAFMKLPPGSITPKGWLRKQLELDADGLLGRMPETSRYLKYEGNGWVDPTSNQGWEEMPYWLRGYGDLGYVLKDEKIIATTRKWLEGIMAAQRPDGYFGPERLKTAEKGLPDLWPHMLVLDALHSFYDYTGDPRVIPFMLKYFKWQNGQPLASYRTGWGALRWADNLAIIYWLYNKTDETWLLDLGKKIHENSVNYTNNIPNWHNVNLAQGIREPAEYWLQAKDDKFLLATEQDYQRIMGTWGQFPGGGFAGDENIRQPYRDPRQGFETCGFAEFMHTFEMMTRISGNPVWSDRCEDIAFNSMPATETPDHKALHYVTSANCVQLDKQVKGKQFDNKFAMYPYKPGLYDYRCCPHNYGMAWPYYAEELWLATADKGLCSSLYAASEVKAKVADGTEISIAQETDYPFDQTIKLTLSTPKEISFPLYLRVPGWCQKPTLLINGQPAPAKAEGPAGAYLVVNRQWHNGDTVTLQLPMRVSLRTWAKNKDSVSVDYGPLTFSLAIQEKWQRYGGTDQWPEYEVFAASPWNYGLALDGQDPTRGFEVVHKPGPVAANPFTHETAPIHLKAKARKIPGWQPDHQGVVGVLQPSPARSQEPEETVTLIPMGAARLRITSFPTVGQVAAAHDWTTPAPGLQATASHVFRGDGLDALSDDQLPQASNDQGIPRFTWWDHKGTTEWVQYQFPKPMMVSSSSAYWFDDTGKGACRLPQSWRLLYKEGEAWKPVENASPYGTAADTLNKVIFKPVSTTAIRLEVQLKQGFSGGILEWKVESPQGK